MITPKSSILRLKCDGTRAETRFRFLAKRTSPFKQARAIVQLTTGSQGVLISGSRVQLKSDGTKWEVKEKQANGVGSQYSSTLPRNMVYPALLPTIKT